MKKLFSHNEVELEDIYLQVKKRRKSLIIRASIMILFLFGVNVFAWFAYISQADFNFESSVVAWDVDFFEDSSEVEDVVVAISDMYPGMEAFNKTITVNNTGEMNGRFSYEIKSATLFGVELVTESTPSSDVVTSLRNSYPFAVTMTSDKTLIKPNEWLSFSLDVNWEYELAATTYYKVLDIYEYDPSVIYYTRQNSAYVDSGVTADTFESMRSSLVLEKDDADSFFGEACKVYEENNPGEACFNMLLQLKVEQVLS